MQLHEKYFRKVISPLTRMGWVTFLLFLNFCPVILHGEDYPGDPVFSGKPVMITPTITGPDTACAGIAGYIYSTESGMSDYIWTVSPGGTITEGGGTNTITVSWNTPGSESVSVIYTGAPVPAILNVTVLSFSTVAISISPSLNPVCAGSPVTFTAIPSNGGTSPVYQWKVNGINVGNNGNTFVYVPSNGDVVGCQLTSDLPCITGNPATAIPVLMNVNPNVPVSISITASSNPVCQGSQVTYLAVPVNGGTTPSYQWKVNGINSGTNSPGFTYSPGNGDVVVCQLNSNALCTTGNPAVSNPVTMSVSPNQPVSVSIASSANPSCSGNPVTFTATPVNGGTSPGYQWFVNGIMAGSNAAVCSYIPVQGDLVSCRLTSNAICTIGNPAISNIITMTVNENQPVSISIAPSANPVCQGNSVTFTATPSNGGTSPAFQWSINGFNVGTNSAIFNFIPANGDVVSCQLISGLNCTIGNPAISNPVIMNVSPVLPVNVTISASANPVCVGTSVTYSAVAYNGGTSPVFQWKVNGSDVGTNNPEYSYVPVNGDVITCQLTSNATCATGNNALSNALTMTVSPNQVVEVSISVLSGTVCQGMTAEFTATPVNGGSSPAYQWKVNGINSGTNSSFFSYIPLDDDVVICQMTSSAVCTQANPVLSNAVTMVVTEGQTMPVSVTINASANPSCFEQTVTYVATPVNGGTAPAYQWLVNGLNVGTNNDTFSYIPGNGDFVKCVLTSSYICATGNPANSNQINMTVNPVLAPSVSIVSSVNPSCQNASVTYTANVVNAGISPVYQWKVNGLNSGLNQATFTYTPVNGDIVTCQLISSVACPVTNPVESNSITMSVLPVQAVGVSIATPTNPSCQFTQVTYTATPTNGGTSPVYQWKLNGINVGSNNTILTFIPVTGDIVTCQLTSNAICYEGNQVVISNPIVMSVSTELPAGVSIATSLNPFCHGVPVTFTATPVNGGNLPVYQWKVNCNNVGINSPVLNYIPVNGDFVTCQMTSSLVCAVMNPAISNAITMTENTSIPAGVSVAVSANPICQSNTATFTATPVNGGAVPAYQWKVNGIISGSNSSTFIYTPLNGDAVTCRLTSNEACVSGSPATSAPVNMVVSAALPASVNITTKTNPFCQGTSVVFTAVPVNGGPSPLYQWQINGINSGPPSADATFTVFPANGDVITCLLTSNASCISGGNPVTSNPIVMTESASLPAGLSITASEISVCQGTVVTFTATPSNGGDTPVYQWTLNGLNTGTNNPVFTCTPANGDVVACMLTSGLSCATSNPAMSNTITMTVNPVLPVSISIEASSNPCCNGTVVTFTATPVNEGNVPVYQWKVNCVNVGTNSPSYTYTPVNGDVVVCVLSSNALCATGTPAISNNINMVVLPMLPVSLTISTPVNPFCPGSSITFTAEPVNGGLNPVYQWKVDGVNAGTNSATFIYQPSDGDVVTCELTSNLTCVSGNPAISPPLIMIANAGPIVSVSIVSNWNNTNNIICQGTLVLYTATPTNGGASPNYLWKVNGVSQITNYYMFQYTPVNGDVITCQLTSSLLCATSNPATSNAITMTVNPNLPVSVLISASANPSCLGNTVNYNAVVTNGGTNPVYRWRVNGVNAGTSIPTFSYVPVNNDVVLCRVTSNEMCATGNPSNSNSITMIVSPSAPANVTISATANPVCQGTQVTYTATPFNGGTLPVYEWKVNGISMGTNSVTFTYSPANGDTVTCQMTSNSPCTPVTQVISNLILMTVSPIQPVSISIAASSNPTCIASVVTYTATTVNGGTSPAYQWKVNGIVAGSNNPSFTYTPVNGDVITCMLTSNTACSLGNPATSNIITMTVSESLAVGVSIVVSSNPSCQGETITFSATGVNGGANPVYQWRINGIDVGTNNQIFSYTPSNSDFVSCQLTSSFSCGTGNPASSNQISTIVYPSVPVSVSIAGSANPVCDGTSVTYTASAINGGSVPVYQWHVNGVNAGTGLPVISYTPVDGDVVDCQLTSNATCPVNNPVTSTPIIMTVLQPIPAGITITPSVNPLCPGTSVTFTSTIINGGNSPLLQWMVNGIVVANNTQTYTYIPLNGDVVICQLTSTAMCVTGPVATSNVVTMEVSNDLSVSVTITASSNPACLGHMVTYSAIGANGGVTPVYQWMVNGINVGTNNPVFDFTPSNGDVITCQLLSDLICASGNPAISNEIVMVVSQSFPVSVSIGVSSNPVCLGSSATFTATPVNGGSNPVYQWKVNGINAGSNLSIFTYNPVNGDVVTCQISTIGECTTGSPATSDPIVMVVSTDLPVSISISASANPLCQGMPATFTAVTGNAGTNPVYQWMLNGNAVGDGSPVYTYVPVNGDLVSCVLTSDLPCATGNPATSNSIVMNVYTGQTAGVNLVANPSGAVCQGTQVILSALPTNGGTPIYQWYLNGSAVGTNQPTFAFVPADGDMAYVVMTSSLSCVSGSPATSNVVTMTVNISPTASVTIIPDQNNVCQGTMVIFTATPLNGGTPSFQWHVNGLPVGTDLSVFSYIPTDGDEVDVVMTSTLACVSGSPANSNTVVMDVISLIPAGVTLIADLNNVCEGTAVTFTAIPSNGGTPAYQWYKNSLPIGLNQPTYMYIPVNNDQVYVKMTSNLSCVSGNPAFSNVFSMLVNPILPVSVSVSPDQNNICQGTNVTFTATPSNGGTPSYQWYKNSLPVGLNQPTYTYAPANGDEVQVVMTSNLSCTSGSPATSNTVTMAVTESLPASVTIVPDQNNICQGTLVTYTATPLNGGTPAYQWYVNGLPVGSNLPVYSYFPSDNDQVYVSMTSTLICVSGSPASSNTVMMVVIPPLQAGVSVVANQNNVCEGTSVTFTATPSNGGTPTYQWYINSIPVGLNQPAYTYIPVNGDLVYVVMTSSLTCITGSPATSNTVLMIVNPILPVSVSIVPDQNNICQGTLVTFTATPLNGGTPFYQWHVNGFLTGTNQPVFSYVPSDGDQVDVTMTSSLSCVTGNPANSNTVVMVVIAPVQAGVSITADQNNVCDGTSVTFTATPSNGGTPIYQWYKNSIPVGLNLPTYTDLPADGDQVYVEMTSTLMCVTANPATSNIITMIVNPLLPVTVTVIPDQVIVCEGTPVTYTAVPVNGGIPSFQWHVNGLQVGTSQPIYSYIPSNGDQVDVSMTSSLTCISGSPASSNTVVMVVNAPVQAGVTIASDQNDVCEGTSVTLTASPVNGGTPAYQWFINSLPAGENQPVYTYIPVNGDQINVIMTSTQSCVFGSPATSNTVTMTVKPIVPVSVSIAADQNDICQGIPVIFTASPSNEGIPNYQWYTNGIPAGLNQSTYSYLPVDGDQVFVVMTSDLMCTTGNPATSNIVLLSVKTKAGEAGTIGGLSSVCAGAHGMEYSVAPVQNASAYLWSVPSGANIVAGNNTDHIIVDFNDDAGSGDIFVQGTNSCGSGSFSPAFQVSVNPVPPTPLVTIEWPVLQSSISEGNQWYFQDTLIAGATGQTYEATEPGWYWSVVTVLGCSSDSSNHVYVDGTDPGKIDPGIKVYPVPNDGKFTVSISLLSPETFNISIYNCLGEKLYELADILVANQFKKVIDLRPKARGMYSVVFKSQEARVVKKILIDKK